MEIRLKLDPDAADEDVIRNGLRDYNERAGGPTEFQPVAFMLHDEAGQAVGGLMGVAFYDWLYVQYLHVPQSLRRQGLGRQLLERAEAFARERGLTGVWLDTFDFQARPFYEKLGYRLFGTLPDHPVGGARHFLAKRLDGP